MSTSTRKPAQKHPRPAAPAAATPAPASAEDAPLVDDIDDVAPSQPNKKARVDSKETNHEVVEAAGAAAATAMTVVPSIRPSRLAAIMQSLRPRAERVQTLDELLRIPEARQGFLTEEQAEAIKARFCDRLMGTWERNPAHFSKMKLDPAAYTLMFVPHTDSQVPSMTGVWSMEGPLIRSPLFVGAQRASVTPGIAKAEKEAFKKSDEKKNDSSGYYLNIIKLNGTNDLAVEHDRFIKFLQEDLTSFLVMMMLRVKTKPTPPSFPPRGNAHRELLNDKKNQYTGKYDSPNSIPMDDPIFIKHRNIWRSDPAIMMVMNPQLMVDSATKPITFSASADNYRVEQGKPVERWIPMPITYNYITPSGRVEERPVPDEGSVRKLFDLCPYGVDFRLKVKYDTNNNIYKTTLEMKKIVFFPQLAMLNKAAAQIDQEPVDPEEAILLQALDMYERTIKDRPQQQQPPQPQLQYQQPPAVTHESATANGGEYAGYRGGM